jgi:hypothetical protein
MLQKNLKISYTILLFFIFSNCFFHKTYAENINFKDINNHWAKKYIISLNTNKIINGYPDNTFKPDNHITRAESFTILSKAFYKDYKTDNTISYTFKDSNDIPNWSKPYFNLLFENKIVYGGINTYVYPKAYMTRLDFTIYISKILNLDKPTDNAIINFNDNEYIEDWSIIPIYNITKLGIMSGYADNTFRPNNKITRGEISKIIFNSLDFINNYN